MTTVSQSGALDQSMLNRVLVSSVVGTAIEWYDFFLYATASALVFAKLFFPSFDPVVGTIAAFGTFAVGYIARPFGAVFFGHFGDRIGRKVTLVATLMIMGVATFIIGILPTYETIGVRAPVGRDFPPRPVGAARRRVTRARGARHFDPRPTIQYAPDQMIYRSGPAGGLPSVRIGRI